MARKRKLLHHADIRVMYTGGNQKPNVPVTEGATLGGFESYKVQTRDGKNVKIKIPYAPLVFEPSPEDMRDGKMVSGVSDTLQNRVRLQELSDAGTVMVLTEGIVKADTVIDDGEVIEEVIDTVETYGDWKKAELEAELETRGIEFKPGATNAVKAQLLIDDDSEKED